MTASPNDLAHMELVEEHIRRENAHDLPGIMATLGRTARYDDEPWGQHHQGLVAVRGCYEDLPTSLLDLRMDVTNRLVAESGIALEAALAHPVTVARASARKLTTR